MQDLCPWGHSRKSEIWLDSDALSCFSNLLSPSLPLKNAWSSRSSRPWHCPDKFQSRWRIYGRSAWSKFVEDSTNQVYLLTFVTLAETSGGTFQIRPHKDFIPSKGRDRLLSLRLLSELPLEDNQASSHSDLSSNSEHRSAYDFMRSRRETGADPTLKRWNASIRLSNFATVESSPLCVCAIVLEGRGATLTQSWLDRFGRCIAWSSYSGTGGGWARRWRSRRSRNKIYWVDLLVCWIFSS